MSPNDPTGASLFPPPPEFGELLPIQASPETIALLARRRSASASVLGPPGPSSAEVELMLRLAGFEVEAVYGGFEGESFIADSDHLIVLARRS